MRPGFFLFLLWGGLVFLPAAQSNDLPRFGSGACSLGQAFEIGKTGTKRWQRRPAIAFDGQGTYLAVWQEGVRQGNIYGIRMGENGKILDTRPFIICQEKGGQRDPLVVFGNGVFLVVWSDFRSKRDYDLYGARVSPKGRVLDEGGFPVSKGKGNRVWPALGGNDNNFVVVWSDFRNGIDYDIYLTKINPEGPVDNLKEELVSGKTRGNDSANLVHELKPSLTWDGEDFWLSWLESFHDSSYSHTNRKIRAHLQIYDNTCKKKRIKESTVLSTGWRSMAPSNALYGREGVPPLFLFTFVRFHYQKSMSYLAVAYIDPDQMTFNRFKPYLPSDDEKKTWFDLLNFNPESSALNNLYFKDTENGPLAYSYLIVPETHLNRWTAALGSKYFFVVTEFKKGIRQGIRGWVLKEGRKSSPISLPAFQIEDKFITAAPAVAADGNGGALMVYEADRGINDCVIMGRIIRGKGFPKQQ